MRNYPTNPIPQIHQKQLRWLEENASFLVGGGVAASGPTVPSAPTNLAFDSGTTTLTWDASAGATSYKLYISIDGGEAFPPYGSNPVASPLSAGFLANGNIVYVTAVNSAGESSPSDPITIFL